MTMRIAAVALVLAAAFVGAASAASKWNGAGWYVVEDGIGGLFVESGPYASKEACEPNRPASEDYADYACEYLSTKPTWDD